MDGQPSCITRRTQSEDCLTLDVYTRMPLGPARSPVVLWLYGGSLVDGYSTRYAGLSRLAASGEIVLVSINYRVGPLGWMAHPALSQADPRGVSGNYGLLDMQLALAWVRDNIADFGGRSDRVTLLGQSSGGTAILALLASPGSRGLFHGAVFLSGSPNITMGLREAELQNEAVVAHSSCGWTSNTLLCLLNMPAAEVAKMFPATFDVTPSLPQSPAGQQYPGLPIVDGVTVTTDALTALSQGLVDVPLMLQTTLAEMDTYLPHATVYGYSPEQYRDFLIAHFAAHGWDGAAAGQAVASLYANETQQSVELAYQEFIADLSFLCGNLELARAAAGAFASSVYAAVTVHSPGRPLYTHPGDLPALYPGHFWDYVAAVEAWDFFSVCSGEVPLHVPTPADESYGHTLRSLWMQFFVNGTLTPGFGTVNSDPSFPAGYAVGLLHAAGANMSQSYAAERCTSLRSAPLRLGQSFWLTN
jgi:carboxylesterase type B